MSFNADSIPTNLETSVNEEPSNLDGLLSDIEGSWEDILLSFEAAWMLVSSLETSARLALLGSFPQTPPPSAAHSVAELQSAADFTFDFTVDKGALLQSTDVKKLGPQGLSQIEPENVRNEAQYPIEGSFYPEPSSLPEEWLLDSSFGKDGHADFSVGEAYPPRSLVPQTESATQTSAHHCERIRGTENEFIETYLRKCSQNPRKRYCMFPRCSELFVGKLDLAREHVKVHLRINKLFKCSSCTKEFSTWRAAKRHQETQSKKFECNICHRSFSRKDYVDGSHKRSCAERHMLEELKHFGFDV